MPRPILQIDLSQATPAYEQIASGLRRLLVEGAFRVGDQLPTVRRLAMDLGVHHNTVAEAYRILAGEGWLDLRRGRGAIAVKRRESPPSARARARFGQELKELVAKAIAEGVPRSAVQEEMDSLEGFLRKGR
jgi:DNA-binding transcriptional regulator YhcF (GntR family)